MNIEIFDEPGWIGGFTRHHVPGSIPNGTRIAKCNSAPSDGRPDGALGTVLGGMSHPDVENGAVCYFIEWDSHPRVAVGCMFSKVRRADQ